MVIEPHIPKLNTGKRRTDDRQLITGPCIGLLSGVAGGLFWRCIDPNDGVQPLEPPEQAGLWQRILSPLADAADPPVTAMIDWSSVKARRPAVGAKIWEASSRPWPVARQLDDRGPNAGRRRRQPSGHSDRAWLGHRQRVRPRPDRLQTTQPAYARK